LIYLYTAVNRIYLAPMMDCTDRHFRFLLRLISKQLRLYTEMITTQAILRGRLERVLGYDHSEHPVVLQLGGSDPTDLAKCAAIAETYGYDEVNLNCGCPSDRVQSGRFGACLMAEPELVAEAVAAMRGACNLPVTVKTRIGIDDQDSYDFVARFIATVSQAGCREFSMHARKAWLSGLSPKENREVPPLRYDVVAQLQRDFGDLRFVLNGGINSLDEAAEHLKTFPAVMMGRELYRNPMAAATIDSRFHGDPSPLPKAEEVIETYRDYVVQRLAAGDPLTILARHLHGMLLGRPGGKAFRRALGEGLSKRDAGAEIIDEALKAARRGAEKAKEIAAAYRAEKNAEKNAEKSALNQVEAPETPTPFGL
jgi:tRNA-dihydrouridine synthase A